MTAVDDGAKSIRQFLARLQRLPAGMEDGASAFKSASWPSRQSIRSARVAKGNHQRRQWPCADQQRTAKQKREVGCEEAEAETEDWQSTKTWTTSIDIGVTVIEKVKKQRFIFGKNSV